MEYTKGIWQPAYISGVCIGVEATTEIDGYTQMIVNTILPESDKEYKKEKAEIIANAKLISACPDMYEALLAAKHELELYIPAIDVKVLDQINEAIQKATL